MTSENATFRLGSALATRSDADSETLYWFVTVTNRSTSLQCFTEASTLEFRGSAGQILTTNDSTFVSGSVGMDGSTYTDTCLGSGETGYFFGIELEDETPFAYSSVSTIAISTVDSSASFDVPAARIIPQRYSVGYQGLSVTVRNKGTGAARIGDFSHYFLLDDGNLPLSWGFFENDFATPADNPVIDVGETTVLNDFLFYDGLTNKVQAQLDFVSLTDSLSAEAPTFLTGMDVETANKRYASWRSRQEQAKRELIERRPRHQRSH